MLLNSLSKFRRSSRNAFFAALIAIAAIGMYNWVIVPHSACLYAAQRYQTVINELARHKEALSRIVDKKAKNLEKLSRHFAELEGKVLISDKVEKFAGDLQSASKQAGCVVYSINVVTKKQRAKNKQPKDTLIIANTLEVSLVGEYKNVVALVEKLQSRSGKVWIDSVKMEILNEDSAQLRCDMTITIYSISEKEINLNE